MKKTLQTIAIAIGITLTMQGILTGCGWGNGDQINGMKTGQPIMDGWTREMAGEYWLASTLTDDWANVFNGKRGWLSPEELASLDNVNVQVKLPVHADNPMPRMGVTYRQKSTGGHIIFRDTIVADDTLHTVGVAHYLFKEPMYFTLDSTGVTSMVQSRGKGIFTLYHQSRVRDRKTGDISYYPEWNAAVISVYPGGDSLLICRGNVLYDAYIAEK